MNTLDIIVIAIVALSGLFAFMRGFVREVLSIGAWIGAFALAYYAFAPVQPFTQKIITTVWIANAVTAAGLFIIGLLIFSIIVGALSDRVRSSGLGPLDRALGLVFGVARGMLFLCIAYLIASRMLPTDNWPSWMIEARTRPLLASGAAALQNLIPHSMLDQGTKALDRAGQTMNTVTDAADLAAKANAVMAPPPAAPDEARNPAKPKNADPASGYDSEQSREMTRAIDQSLGSGQK